jgi:hypothetical protein
MCSHSEVYSNVCLVRGHAQDTSTLELGISSFISLTVGTTPTRMSLYFGRMAVSKFKDFYDAKLV